MPKLKAEFRKPKLTLYNTNYVALGVLTNKSHLSAHNIILNEQVNDVPTLEFDFPMGGLMDGNSLEQLVKYKNEYFVIKQISMSDGDTAVMNISAEHIACELKGIMVGYFEELIGETPENMWNTVIESCSMSETLKSRYVLETNIVETYRYLANEEEKSIFEYLLTIAQQFDSCLLFSTDTYGVIHINLLHGDINRNKFIRKGKDLKQLDLTFNTESLFTKLTPFGGTDDDDIEVNIMDVNNGKSYITNYNYYLAKGMTQEEIDANPLCNQECVYRNEEIFDANELLRLAEEELKRLSEPVVEGNISAIDLNVFEGGSYLSPILCEKVVVIDKDLKYSISCKITSISLNFENPLESQIGISNTISYSSTLKDLIQNSDLINKVITNGNNGKPNINASRVKGIIDGHIAQLKYSMENNITDTTDAVILFENRIEGSDMYGALAIGSRGILISTQVDVVTNQWVWSTAIDARGLSTQMVNAIEINGSQIKGDIISSYDNKTWIDLNDGTFNFANKISYNGEEFVIKLGDGTSLDEWKQEYEENKDSLKNEIEDILNNLGDLDSILGNTFLDGVITEVERIRIEDSLIELEKEKNDVDSRYNAIYNNINLIGTPKTNLNSTYNSFISEYDTLVSSIRNIVEDAQVTEVEKSTYRTNLEEYNATIPPLSVAFDDAIRTIAENNAKTQIGDLKDMLDIDIQNALDGLQNLEDVMNNSFRDGIIDETEYNTIKENISRLNAEKIDIDKNYINLYNNSNLKDPARTNLGIAYDNYVRIHTDLVQYVDVTIGDRLATEGEIENIRIRLDNYDNALADYNVEQNKAINSIADYVSNSRLDEYKTLVGKDISDINVKINDLVLDVEGTIADGLLDKAELLIIKNSIADLEKEKNDIIQRYNNMYNDSNLQGTQKSNLTTKYDAYISKHTNLINLINTMVEDMVATAVERASFETAVSDYRIALGELSVAFDKAFAEISKNMSQVIMNALKEELQSNIDNVQDVIDTLDEYIDGAFRDGILSDAEKESIRTHLRTLTTERKDVDQQYATLYAMEDLEGTAKINLKTAYDNYVTAYDSLVNDINSILNKSTVTSSDRTILTTQFDNHDAKLSTYSQRVNEAIESIAEKKKADLEETINAEIEVLKDSISIRVTSEEVQEVVDSSIGSLTENLTNNYSTTVQMNTAINVSRDSILNSVSSTYTTKDELGNTLSNYTKTSQLQQTEERITATFSLSGGQNLLRNGDARNGLASWSGNGGSLTLGTSGADPFIGGNEFVATCPHGMKYFEALKLKSDTEYIYEGWIYANFTSDGDTFHPLHCWCQPTPNTVGQDALTVLDYRQNVVSGKFCKLYLHFKTKSNTQIYFTPFVYGGEEGNRFVVRQLSLREGKTESAWTPHPDEVYTGITSIDNGGITVSHSNVSSTSRMNANGFYISDSSGDVIAELSSSERWSTLKADYVYAQNVERVYTGDANLFIDHGAESNGDGTSLSPFNSFTALSSHFEDKGTILNKDVTVNIAFTTKELSEQLHLENLKGKGTLKISYSAFCTHRPEGSENNILLEDIDCHVWIIGGRSSYNTSDGALLAESTESGSGIKIVGCKNVLIEALSISRSNWGLYVDRSHVRVRRVDFCNTWCCVEAVGCSHVSMEDCCGNAGASHGGDAMRAGTGSMIVYGNGTGGSYVPYGKIIQYEGGCWKIGSPAQTGSFKTVSPKPATSDRVQSFTSTGYGYYSVGQACWNPNGQKVYQGDWGYGNNKGIYLLPNSSINSFYSGSTIVNGATIKLTRANAGGYSSAQYVYLCGTTATAVGSGSNPPVTKSYGSIGTLAWGQTKTFTLPSAFVSDLKAGVINSVMFYVGDGSSYILFANSCTLTLKCNK